MIELIVLNTRNMHEDCLARAEPKPMFENQNSIGFVYGIIFTSLYFQ